MQRVSVAYIYSGPMQSELRLHCSLNFQLTNEVLLKTYLIDGSKHMPVTHHLRL